MTSCFLPALTALAVSQLATLAPSQSTLHKIDLVPDLVPKSSFPGAPLIYTDGYPRSAMVEVAGYYYFTAWAPGLGTELYRTDGTQVGTTLVHDLTPGAGGTTFSDMKALGGRLYFVANSTLWSTAGTSATTKQESSLVLTPVLPEEVPNNFPLTVTDTHLFFSSSTGPLGEELFVLDPTSGLGPIGIDISPGVAGSNPEHLVAHPNGTEILFEVVVSGGDSMLWKSDGTAGGTSLVKNVSSLIGGSEFAEPQPLGNGIVFLCNHDSISAEPFFTDGTPGGTFPLADIYPGNVGSWPNWDSRGLHNGKLYFTAQPAPGGWGLYQTDGTPGGTLLVQGATPGTDWADRPVPIGVAGGKLIVHANLDPGSVGKELYRLDPAGLTLLKDISPGAVAGVGSSLRVGNSIAMGGKLLFGTGGPYSGGEDKQRLWVTDGTAQGTWPIATMVTNDVVAPDSLTAISPTSAIFAGSDGIHGVELFRTDGTPAGTTLVADLNPGLDPVSSEPFGLATVNGAGLYFSSQVPGVWYTRMQRWNSHGGIETVREMTGSGDGLGAWLGDHLGASLRIVNWEPGAPIFELLQVDSLGSSSKIVTDVAGSLQIVSAIIGADTEQTLFVGHSAAYGSEVWTTDGTDSGTYMVADTVPGPTSGVGDSFGFGSRRPQYKLNGYFFFVASTVAGNRALWKTDGTTAGTMIVKDVHVSTASAIHPALIVGETLYFMADDGVHGTELWRSDGTGAGTFMVKDVTPASVFTSTRSPVLWKGDLYFFTGKGTTNGALWKSDGTEAGTVALIYLDLKYVDETLVPAGDRIYFEGYDPVHGQELWAFDGTTLSMVRDLEPGPIGARALGITAVGNHVYFQASTATHGAELFVSDGTTLGTHLAVDINTGPASSDPKEMTLCDGDLFFSAMGTDGDRELYRYTQPGAHVLDLGLGDSDARLSSSVPMVGGLLTVALDQGPPGSLGVLLFGPVALASKPFPSLTSLSWLDIQTLGVLGSGSGSSWTYSANLPPSAQLIGFEVNLQAWFSDVATGALTSSNGLRLVLGI